MYRKFLLTIPLLASVLGLPSRATAHVLTRSGYATQLAGCCVVTADFNHDGIVDLAVGAFEGTSGVQVFVGKGDGTFKPPVAYAPGAGANALATADLNHDGNPDIVIANDPGTSVTVLLGNGDGTFQPPVSYATNGESVAVVIGDFDNDGNLDIASADTDGTVCNAATGECITVLLGNGDGTFREPGLITYPPFGGLEALAAGNFTGGKNVDLALTESHTFSDTAQILLGNGDGTFTLGASYALNPGALAITAADLRNNGTTDLVLAVSDLVVLLGNGDGTFQQPVEYDFDVGLSNTFASSLNVAIGDMNGDGIPDLVAVPYINANDDYSAVYIFPGKGDGTFGSPEISYPSAYNSFPRGIALADFNGDHQLDVTFADQFGQRDGVSQYVLLNTGTVKFSPITPLSFGAQLVGATTRPATVTLTNNGSKALAISSMTASPSFGVSSTCGKSVAAGATCDVNVTFSPTSLGAKLGSVSIQDSASSKPQVIEVSGHGTDLSLLPNPMKFAAQKVGTSSAPQLLSVTNYSSTSLILYWFTVAGADKADFTLSNTGNCTSQVLAAGATCSIDVTFTPQKTGARSATITLSDAGGGSPEAITVTGTGD